MADFAFLVHPLVPFHQQVLGFRAGHPARALGLQRRGPPGVLCRLRWAGLEGRVVALSMTPADLMADQEAAVEEMVLAAQQVPEVRCLGLGALLAVVGGRGEALASRLDLPVTTGAAATAWAACENTLSILQQTGETQVGVLGFRGAVGQGLSQRLAGMGYEVVVAAQGRASQRRAERLGLRWASLEETVRAHRVIVGASTTGGIVPPDWLQPHAVLLDVALPPTLLPGRRPEGVLVLAGEAVEVPEGWSRGFWGWAYQVLAGYGPWQIFACLAEPMVAAALGREEPFALGRSLEPEALEAFSQAAAELGLRPRLARGWRAFPLPALESRPRLEG